MVLVGVLMSGIKSGCGNARDDEGVVVMVEVHSS